MAPQCVKIQLYCPVEHEYSVRKAIGDAGGGAIGNYRYCAFVMPGRGYFLPMDGANPSYGDVGTLEQVDEVKIELICQHDRVAAVVAAMIQAHPYEEVAYDILPLLSLEEFSTSD